MTDTAARELVGDIQVDKNNLYREEAITDLNAATIRRLMPIKVDGSDDPGRKPIYVGHTQLMTQRGPLPVQGEIEADTLEEALDKFPTAIHDAVERMMEEVREMQRQAATRIVTPGESMGGGSNLILK